MLTFLKIIGTILLVILLVIIVLLFLVLFVPFRYSLEFEYKKDRIYAKARVTWLMIFRFYLTFIEKKLAYKFKILFLTMLNSERTKKPKSAKKHENEPVSKCETEILEKSVEEKPQEPVKETTGQETVEKATENEPGTEETGKPKKKFNFKLLHPSEIFYIISQKIADTYWKIRHSVMASFNKLDKICAMITDPDNKEAVVLVLSQVKVLLKHVLPTKHGIYVKAGFADPATTGQALGAYSVINSILGLNFVLEPDFDNEVLEAKVFVKGRIRVINLVIIGIKVITNKTIRKFIRRK